MPLLSEIFRYATEKIDSMFEEMHSGGSVDFGELAGIWNSCPNCHQCYENDLDLATAAGFVNYVEEKDIDQELKAFLRVEAHMTFLSSLRCSYHLNESYIKEGRQVCNKIQKRLLPKVQKSTLVPQQRKLELDADLHRNGISFFARKEGDYEAALAAKKRARELFEVLASGAIPLTYDQDYEGEFKCIENLYDQINGKSRIISNILT